GIELSAETLRQPPKLSGFPKPLRNLLSHMLHPNPDQRPKDLVVLGEMIRSCLLKIERRLALADRYGIPFRTTIPRPNQPRTLRQFPIRLKLRPRIFNKLKHRAANRRPLRPKTLSRPIHQAQFQKIPLRPRFLIHRRKLPRLRSPPLPLSRVHVAKRNASLRHRYLARDQCASGCLE